MVASKERKKAQLIQACNEITRLTGWRVMAVYANQEAEDSDQACGVILGDQDCFELLCDAEEEA